MLKTEKILIKAIAMLFIAVMGCSGFNNIKSDHIVRELSALTKYIRRNKNNIGLLKNRKIGETGYFYIINAEGQVIYHPESMLIGSNFKRYDFIKNILERREGCYYYNFGTMHQLIYFVRINENDILCLTIRENEVDDSAKYCRPARGN